MILKIYVKNFIGLLIALILFGSMFFLGRLSKSPENKIITQNIPIHIILHDTIFIEKIIEREAIVKTERKAKKNYAVLQDTSKVFEIDTIKKKLITTYYHKKYHGRRTASGEIYDSTNFTAAHKSLPFGTEVLIENPRTLAIVKVKINDRYFKNGIDLSKAAAVVIGASNQRFNCYILKKIKYK